MRIYNVQTTVGNKSGGIVSRNETVLKRSTVLLTSGNVNRLIRVFECPPVKQNNAVSNKIKKFEEMGSAKSEKANFQSAN